MATGVRKTGDFCWINMLTPEPKAARDFFGKLLGWKYSMIPGIGHRIQVAGSDIGGLFDLDSPQTPKGTPPHIGVMVKVDSADATVAKVAELGGRAMPPFDILFQGRMAVCFDVNGANFDLWQPKAGAGTDVDGLAIGAPSWYETMTTDAAKGRAFYESLFGWTAETMDMGGFQYTTFKNGDDYVAGMMELTPEMTGIPPHWAVYFTVADADATAQRATELGGTVIVPAQDVPNVGRFCGLRSPQGVVFFVMRYTQA